MDNNMKKMIAFSIPMVALVGMTISPLLTITTGKEIKLETKPVDPRDLFRGDYVTLSYQAEEVHESKLDNAVKDYFLEQNASSYRDEPLVVYSVLKENKNGIYEVDKVVTEKPKTGVFLEGEMDYLWIKSDEEIREYAESEKDFESIKANQTADIYYELDKFFVPENTGKELEDAINQVDSVVDFNSEEEGSPAIATIKVRNGHAILTNVEAQD
ncbi:hypothetical protein CVD28_00135 [Bacillus sp. M6-12]|nr:hypothetical protein CVD28_00135 [Bacillus sp. M6-12]